MSKQKVDLSNATSDNEIRESVSHLPNGKRAVEICGNCGSYWTAPNGWWECAMILSKCKYCSRVRKASKKV